MQNGPVNPHNTSTVTSNALADARFRWARQHNQTGEQREMPLGFRDTYVQFRGVRKCQVS